MDANACRALPRPAENEPLLSARSHRHGYSWRIMVMTLSLVATLGYVTVNGKLPGNKQPFALAALPHVEQRGEAASMDAAWAAFKETYGKQYKSDEEECAFRSNFEARIATLNTLNAANGEAVFGVTKHADRPMDERAYYRGRRPRSADSDSKRSHLGRVVLESAVAGPLPEVVDWRNDTRGVVTPVKNQGQCGSCWAFSATEQIESQLVLAGSPAVELSPQQLASCVTDPAVETCCDGCGGGDPSAAYEYLIGASLSTDGLAGLAPEAYWPYAQSLTPDQTCEAPMCTKSCDHDVARLSENYEFIGPYAVITGYGFASPECVTGDCATPDLSQLAARAAESPVSVCVNAEAWDDYVGGILTADACGGSTADDIDHCVQLVGYNRNEGYWILRNSWSSDWGEDGYIRLEFDQNTCGLANEATVVQIAGQWGQPALS